MLEEYPDILTTQQVIKILSVSRELLYELIHTKQIPAYRLGKKAWRFNKKSIIKRLNTLEK